jgi:hypothetical protein
MPKALRMHASSSGVYRALMLAALLSHASSTVPEVPVLRRVERFAIAFMVNLQVKKMETTDSQ